MDAPASPTADVTPAGSDQPTQYGTPQLDDMADNAENSPTNDDTDDQPQKPIVPMQKRRRVTRACDECRRKKIKCDGKNPCTHCTVYSYECTYDQPSNRRRNAQPQYVEALETQLKRAKALLHIVFPAPLDLNDPSIDAHLQNGMLPQMPLGAPRPPQIPLDPRMAVPRREEHAREDLHDASLESMVKSTGQLDLDEEGSWEYHGHSSGLSFMRTLQNQFRDIIQAPASSSPFAKYRTMSQVFDSPNSAQPSPADSTSVLPPGTDLPPKKEARILCDNALIDAGALLRVVHLPSFYKSMDRLYETSPENYGTQENNFLPLLYAVLALGTLFPKREKELDAVGYESTIDEGFKYFRASRQLLDIADCRDLTSLQAIVFMIQFLQCSAKLSTCYAYIGVALRSALRMGLHRSFNVNFNPIETEIRKRLFWVIRKMDTYVGAMLGLPHFLDDEDVDQEWPVEVDDEYITETEVRPMPEGRISVMAAANAHTRIVQVLSKICKYVYPIKGNASGSNTNVTYAVSYSKIREIEQDLAQWLDQLPAALRPGGEAPTLIIRTVDQRAFACASACISVSRNIIHITAEMKRGGLPIGAYWFTMYTTFFAIVSLLYFVLENPNSPTSHDLLREAQEGKEILAHFAKRSMAADRCTATLNSIFEKLPEALKRGGDLESKKRRQGSSPQSLMSRPNLLKQDEFAPLGPRRASTFPESIPISKRTLTNSLPMHNQFGAYNSPGSDFFDPAPSLTPTSSTSNLMGTGQTPAQSFPPTPLTNSFVDPSGVNVPLSDVSALMFPSGDPMAYPNQPMTTFENSHPQSYERKTDSPTMGHLPFQVSGIDMKPPHTFSPIGMGPLPIGHRRPTDNEVQLFGPMPMYLMQGAQLAGAHGQRHFHPSLNPQNPPVSGAENMNFEELFGGEEWTSMFTDQGMGVGGPGPGYGGNPGFPPSGHRMAWR